MPYKDPKKQSEYQIEWTRRRREAWISENGPCVDCGGSDDLQVDHEDASTKVTHRVWFWREERRLAELSKCVVRCRECHKRKTYEANEYVRGESHGNAKFTADEVREMRRLHGEGQTPSQIAKVFDSDRRVIYDIVARRTWRHI